jgi:hypothetical protein
MFWFWFSVIIILILTGLAIFWAVRSRRLRLERKLRLEIVNQGNVESHFQLRVEELSGGLEFRFTHGGNRLPEVIEPFSQAPAAGQQVSTPAQTAQAGTRGTGMNVSRQAQKTMGLSYTLAGLLTSVGGILPSSLGSHLIQAGNKLYSGQAQVSRVQQVGSQASALAPGTRSSAAPAAAATPQPQAVTETVQGIPWVETPAVQPGHTLGIDLLVRSAWVAADVMRSFQIKSRSTEDAQARMILEDGRVEIRGGFWSRRFLPHLLILTVAILALLLTIWIARTNGLPV